MRKNKLILVLLSLVLIFAMAMPVFAEAAAEKVAAYDALMAEQEAAASSPGLSSRKYTNNQLSLARGGTTRPSVSGRQIVGSGDPKATMAGYNILMNGGTAFDAAVAVAAVQGIIEPGMTNFLGGDAMIMVWSAEDQKLYTYNGTGWAPGAATIDYYLDLGGIPATGPKSIQLPGGFAGWMTLLEDYGTLPLEDIFAPIIEVASGLYLDETTMSTWNSAKKSSDDLAVLFGKPDGTDWQYGDIWSNPDLVKTLNEILEASKKGATLQESYKLAKDYYYRGPIAEKIVAWSEANDGILTLDDFNSFDAEIQEPWSTTFEGYDIYVCPPNSQGPVLLEALNILENFDIKSMGRNSAEYIDIVVQALNCAIHDRNLNWGDPRFIDNDMRLVGKEYAAWRAKTITPGVVADEIPDGQKWGYSFDWAGSDTTFMYCADKYGNIVVSTHSLCNGYGSKCVPTGTGIIMNNRMTYFSLDETWPNHLDPHKRTMQTITPTIALKDGKPAFLVGTPGADIQEQAKLQVILNALIWDKVVPQEAIEGTRFVTNAPKGLMHSQQPRTITFEAGDISDETILALEEMGYTVKWGSDRCIGFAWVDDNGFYWGGEDPRTWNGYAVAW